jgi:repressor LexA
VLNSDIVGVACSIGGEILFVFGSCFLLKNNTDVLHSGMGKKTNTDPRGTICRCIEEFWKKYGYGPSVRDLMRACGYRSPRSVAFHLEKLEAEGRLDRGRHARCIRLRAKLPETVRLPIVGAIAAGYAEVQNQLPLGELEVPRELTSAGLKPSSVALRVRGDSMVDAGIYDGDMAIIEQRPAKVGDIVAALLDGETTLKRLIKGRGGLVLKAENPKYPIMRPVERLEIQGVVTGIYRTL